MELQTIIISCIGGLLSVIGFLIIVLVRFAVKSFEDKIDDLMTLYRMSVEEIHDIKVKVTDQGKRIDFHDKEIDRLNEKAG